MLELWGRANAYNVLKPRWLLAELGLDFRHHDIGSEHGDLDTAEFVSLNPHSRIPVLRDGDAIVWESNSLMRYLANRVEKQALYPSEPLQRSQVERWMDWELASLQPAFIDLFWSFYRTPPESHDRAFIDAAGDNCRQRYAAMDQQLQTRSYLAGEQFSLADISCGVSLYRYFNMGLDVEQPRHLMEWYRRLSEREPFQQVVMQPFDELRARLEY